MARIKKVVPGIPRKPTIADQFYYEFPVVRGIQGKKEYYVGMVPINVLKKLLVFDDEEYELPPELRSQRVLVPRKVNEIRNYVADNPETYIFDALCVAFDPPHSVGAGNGYEFISYLPDDISCDAGKLRILMDAVLRILNGQHRHAGLQAAFEVNDDLGDETIAVCFYLDLGQKWRQQAFSDLQKGSKPNESLNLLYNHRDRWAEITRQVVKQSDCFKGWVDAQRTSLTLKSSRLFTFNAVHKSTISLLRGNHQKTDAELIALAVSYWSLVGRHMMDWQDVYDRRLVAGEVREISIATHAITLEALGLLGNDLLPRDDWRDCVERLAEVNFKRDQPALTIVLSPEGKIQKNQTAIQKLRDYLYSQITDLQEPEHE